MDIRSVGGIFGDYNRTIKKTERETSVPKQDNGDKVEISSSAREAQETAAYMKASKAEADIRPEKVEDARRKVEDGFYFSDEVTKTVAQKIADQIILPE